MGSGGVAQHVADAKCKKWASGCHGQASWTPLHPTHHLRACCPHTHQPRPAQPVFYLRSGLSLLAPENALEGQIGRT